MRTIIATLLLIGTTGAASAYCVSVPDDKSSAYVRNNLNKTVCLNEELTDTTAIKNWQVEVNTALNKLDRDFVSNKLDVIKPVVPAIGTPNYGTPSWP
jgi:hypothetical protein